MSAANQTLLRTLISAAEREEKIIENLIAAVDADDKPAILKAARQLTKNRNQSKHTTGP